MPDLSGAVITGSSGIAAAAALRLASRGRRVFIVGRDETSCAELATRLGPAAAGYAVADLQLEDQAENAFAAAQRRLGTISRVIAVAGGSARGHGDGWVHEMSLASWEAALRLNLTTMFLTAREAIRRMRAEGGSVVLTSSVLASSPQPDNFTTHGYAAAKAAISGWVVPLAAAYANDGIRINAVAPGLVRTPMSERAANSPQILAFAGRKQPLAGGMLTPDAVAAVMCSVLEADGMTGQVIAVDGGWSVTSTS